jgi:hypothetical protein
MISSIFLFFGLTLFGNVSQGGPACLHRDSSDPQQLARRRAALSAVRLINTIEAREMNAGRPYQSASELSLSDYYRTQRAARSETVDLESLATSLPGWKLAVTTSPNSYWLMLTDTIDPCGFAFVSNQSGVIYKAEPLQ